MDHQWIDLQSETEVWNNFFRRRAWKCGGRGGNDTVPNSVWRGGDVHSTECRLVLGGDKNNDNAFYVNSVNTELPGECNSVVTLTQWPGTAVDVGRY